jgi:anti-sigma factor RsiW
VTCAEARGSIGAHLLGALDDDESNELFAHLAHCQECAAKHARLSQLVPLLDRAGPAQEQAALPPEAEERLLSGSARRRPRRGWRRSAPALAGVLAGAAATLAIVALLGGLRGSSPAPREAASVQLSPTLEAPTAVATAYVINQNGLSTIALEARGLPAPRHGERYVVWLSDVHAAYAIGTIDVNDMGWGTAILRRQYMTARGTRISIIAVPAKNMRGRARLLVRGTL